MSRFTRRDRKLKALVQEVLSDQVNLTARGLAFRVDEVRVSGNPAEHLAIWGTLHFLPLGSPFCCREPGCHLGISSDTLELASRSVQRRIKAKDGVRIELADVRCTLDEGVELDSLDTGLPPSFSWHDMNRQDALGRTALMRAAARGYDDMVVQLLEAGADPAIRDRAGKSLVDYVHRGSWLKTLVHDYSFS